MYWLVITKHDTTAELRNCRPLSVQFFLSWSSDLGCKSIRNEGLRVAAPGANNMFDAI